MSKKADSKVPVFWISGNYYEARKCWHSHCEKMRAELQSDVSIQDIECGYVSSTGLATFQPALMTDVIMSLKNDDMFDDRPRLFRLYGCPPDYTSLGEYLHLIDKRNQVVFYGPIGYSIPAGVSSRFISAKNSNLFKDMKSWGHVYEFATEAVSDTAAIGWAKRVSSELGKTLDDNAARLLVEYKGKTLDGIYSEINKLVDYCDGKAIGLSDVESVTIPEFTKTVWDFVDSLDLQHYEAAMLHLQKFYSYAEARPDSEFKRDVEGLMAGLEHHFTFLLLAVCAAKGPDGISFNSVMNAVKGLKKLEKARAKAAKEAKESDTELSDDIDDKKAATAKEWICSDRDAYEYGFLKVNFGKDTIMPWLRGDTKKVHEVLLDVYRCSQLCRMSSDKDAIKEALSSFVMLVCGKITLSLADHLRRPTMDRFV